MSKSKIKITPEPYYCNELSKSFFGKPLQLVHLNEIRQLSDSELLELLQECDILDEGLYNRNNYVTYEPPINKYFFRIYIASKNEAQKRFRTNVNEIVKNINTEKLLEWLHANNNSSNIRSFEYNKIINGPYYYKLCIYKIQSNNAYRIKYLLLTYNELKNILSNREHILNKKENKLKRQKAAKIKK